MYAVCKTDIGRLRSMNQDICRCGTLPANGAWSVVCDGMGGANGGNIASEIACTAVAGEIERAEWAALSDGEAETLLTRAVEKANREVYTRAVKEKDLRGMGTTVVAAVAVNGRLHVAHTGDSRCYVVSHGAVRQVTKDHSYVQQLVESGAITEEEARIHPQKNLITRVVGVHPDVQCDTVSLAFGPDDLAISCTDGLSNYLERDTLLLFTGKYSGEQLAEALVAFANAEGGSDNITVAVLGG